MTRQSPYPSNPLTRLHTSHQTVAKHVMRVPAPALPCDMAAATGSSAGGKDNGAEGLAVPKPLLLVLEVKQGWCQAPYRLVVGHPPHHLPENHAYFADFRHLCLPTPQPRVLAA